MLGPDHQCVDSMISHVIDNRGRGSRQCDSGRTANQGLERKRWREQHADDSRKHDQCNHARLTQINIRSPRGRGLKL